MDKIYKLFTLILLFTWGNSAIAQTHFVLNYEHDANGNRFKRTWGIMEYGKMNPFDTIGKTPPAKIIKESLSDSFGIKEIVIFPNPTYNTLNVNIVSAFISPLVGTIKVLNIIGSTQYISQAVMANNEIDLSLLAAGHYVLRLEVNGEIKTFKVIKN